MKVITIFLGSLFLAFFSYFMGVQAGAKKMYVHQVALRAHESKDTLMHHSSDVGNELFDFHNSVISDALIEYGKYIESFKMPVIGLGDIGSMTEDLFESVAAYRKANPLVINGDENIKLYDQLPQSYKEQVDERKRQYDEAMTALTDGKD